MIIIGDIGFSEYFEEALVINSNEKLPSPVSTHVDMNLCVIDDVVFLPKENHIADLFLEHGYKVVIINEELGNEYPYDVPLNCRCVGNTVILNRKTVSKEILDYCENTHKKIIDVPQGYAACSCACLNETAFITADKGIYDSLIKNSLSPLLIREGYIKIDEYDYGFIGGASGFCGDTLCFFGDITKHPDYEKIEEYLNENNIKFRYFDEPLTDIGGIFDLKSLKKDV